MRVGSDLSNNLNESKKYMGIVPFVATPLKGQFGVFSKWLLIGYFRLGYIGLGTAG